MNVFGAPIPGMKYSLTLSSHLEGEGVSQVKFSKTKDGPINTSQLTGKGGHAEIYLEPIGDAGFIKIFRE